MIVDSTALPEQAVRDIVNSAFRSAGQRCSALRCLYVQEDIAPNLIAMIKGAMDQLAIGDPWALSTDVGPVIDVAARQGILDYIEQQKQRVIHQVSAPHSGYFVPPTMLQVSGIDDLDREVFGPVLHVATFRARDLEQVIATINARGFGLTFGLHTRIDSRVQQITDAIRAGNIYVNRNQIGAVVGSQPFGGEGLSGTGPKAGGPLYLPRFFASQVGEGAQDWDSAADLGAISQQLGRFAEVRIGDRYMPGPTGEMNHLTYFSRVPVLCLGPGPAAVQAQMDQVAALGGHAVGTDGKLPAGVLADLPGISGAIWWGDAAQGRDYAQALASRDGVIVPLICAAPDLAHVAHERHICVDTTAAGGNAALLAG